MRLLLVLMLALPLAGACTRQAPDRVPPRAEGAAPSPSPRADDGGAPAFDGIDASAAAGDASAAAGDASAAAGDRSAQARDAGRDAPSAGGADAAAEVAVKIATIGMHVGGGPYDEATKAPMKRSVEPRFPDLARCWKLAARSVPTDVGVDLVIEAAGGRAKVSNPRTAAVGEGFVPCVVTFFEGVDFEKPKFGKTVVSYSVRFRP